MATLPLRKQLGAFRRLLARSYVRRRLKIRQVTVVSDDCWGGQVYSEFHLPCHTPFISLGVHPTEYVDFLCHLREPGALDVIGTGTHPKGYPLLRTRHAWLYGLHYETLQDMLHTYERRRRRILWDRLFIKIDFGKAEYTPESIARWNELKFPNSVALYPDEPAYRAQRIHHGVALPDWHTNGDMQFPISCRRFDFFHWLNTGQIERSLAHRCLQFLLLERRPVERLRERAARLLGPVPRPTTPAEEPIPAELTARL